MEAAEVFTDDQKALLEEAARVWLDWNVAGAWVQIDPDCPEMLQAAGELVARGALVAGPERRVRLSPKSRLALAAQAAEYGKAGAVLKRPLDGRRRTRRKGSR